MAKGRAKGIERQDQVLSESLRDQENKWKYVAPKVQGWGGCSRKSHRPGMRGSSQDSVHVTLVEMPNSLGYGARSNNNQ